MSDPSEVARLLESAEHDRYRELARASRILHDDIGGTLTAVGLALDLLGLDHPEACESLQQIRPKLEAIFRSVRMLSYDLDPDVVLRAGLFHALERLAIRYGCEFEGQAVELREPAQATAFHRIAACALDNAQRHSGADRIQIRLAAGPPVFMEISDNGSGFDAKRTKPAFGLRLIRHLAARNRLSAEVSSSPGQGTILRISATSGATNHAA